MPNKVFLHTGAWYVATAKALSSDLEITGIIDDSSLAQPSVLAEPTVARNYANDAAAATGGIPVGGLYHTAGAIKIRLS